MLKMTTCGIGFAWILAFPVTSCIMIPPFIVAPFHPSPGSELIEQFGIRSGPYEDVPKYSLS
jgi:hypothetical protein